MSGFLQYLHAADPSDAPLDGEIPVYSAAGQGYVPTTLGGISGVTTTGGPANGNLAKFTGSSTISNGDLSGDATTSGTLVVTLANSGVTAGSYGSVWLTVDAKGRATAVGSNYLCYQEQQAQNTAGGTFSSGAWRTRTLNTEVSDASGFGTLSSNQITLTAGTYIVSATAPGWNVNRHQLRLQNVTDTATLVTGLSHFTANTGLAVDYAQLRGIFTIAASKAIELQHQCQTTKTTDGFGVASNFTTEIYSTIEFWRVS